MREEWLVALAPHRLLQARRALVYGMVDAGHCSCGCGQPSALLPSCTLASRRRAVLAQSTTTVPRAVDGRMAPFLPLAAAPARGALFRRRSQSMENIIGVPP